MVSTIVTLLMTGVEISPLATECTQRPFLVNSGASFPESKEDGA
jgi:hypothetical protein